MFPVESVHRFRFRCARPVVDSCSTYIPVTWSKMTDGWVWVWWIDHGPMVYQHLNNLPTKMWMKCWFPMIYQHVINISKTQMPKNLSSKFRAPWTLPGGMQLHGGFLLLGLLRAAGVFSASRRFTKWGYQPTGLVLLGCSPSWCHELPSQPGRTLPHAAEGQLSADRLGRRSESQHHSGALVGKTLVIWCWLSRGVSCHMCVQIIINHLWHDDVVYYRCFFFETGPPTLKKTLRGIYRMSLELGPNIILLLFWGVVQLWRDCAIRHRCMSCQLGKPSCHRNMADIDMLWFLHGFYMDVGWFWMMFTCNFPDISKTIHHLRMHFWSAVAQITLCPMPSHSGARKPRRSAEDLRLTG